jgi:hypothetical protein
MLAAGLKNSSTALDSFVGRKMHARSSKGANNMPERKAVSKAPDWRSLSISYLLARISSSGHPAAGSQEHVSLPDSISQNDGYGSGRK